LRFPIDGPRLTFGDYLKGNWWVHFLGIIGGVAWIAGSLANFVAASAPKELQVGPAISYAIGQGSTMWGRCGRPGMEGIRRRRYAREPAAGTDVRALLTGLGVVSIAPLFAR